MGMNQMNRQNFTDDSNLDESAQFLPSQRVRFFGGKGIVRNCQSKSGGWIYLVEMALGPEPSCGRVGAETMIFLNEADLSAARCPIALKPRRLINKLVNKLMGKIMAHTHTVVAHFPSHREAEQVVLELQKTGFDMQKLSIIGKDYQTTEHVRGFFSWKDTAKAGAAGGGYWGSFFGGLFGILAGAGVVFVPGMGTIVIAGPIVGVLAGWLEGMLVGGAGAAAIGGLAGALGGLGIPTHEVLKYETQIQAGNFIILVTGSDEDVSQAKQMIDKISHQVALSIAV